jgi:hypothetical protein
MGPEPRGTFDRLSLDIHTTDTTPRLETVSAGTKICLLEQGDLLEIFE